MTITLARGKRKARKIHQCFHCCQQIAVGDFYGFETNKGDYVYTIAWHLDCEALAAKCRDLMDDIDYDEGWPGLREMWCESGEYYSECEAWRGLYPHVIARMELADQLREDTC